MPHCLQTRRLILLWNLPDKLALICMDIDQIFVLLHWARMMKYWLQLRMVSQSIMHDEGNWSWLWYLGLLKIWNVKTRSCIRSIECGYALCCAFLPGNRHVSCISLMPKTGVTYSDELGFGWYQGWYAGIVWSWLVIPCWISQRSQWCRVLDANASWQAWFCHWWCW